MKLIVGLGNPGRKYEQTRHNVGFTVAEKLAVLTHAGAPKVKFEGELAESSIGGEKVVILCPHTFMNASGQSVRKAFDFYKLQLSDILVVCDDLNLDSGRIRIKPSGSAGGQNGIKDIIRHLGSESFPRLRVGIGRPPAGWTVTDYVLGKFSKSECDTIEAATTRAAKAVISFVTDGVDRTMSQFNGDPGADSKPNQRKPSDQPQGDPRSVGPQ
ncbi:aminoacyl-tRNA hydrolase [Stieleria mannarensis]|uniref:aminoacyl-tRNA hydrolase n=1 Tax=Stieleria mannarensis TaxID=2755585 RepID=UPI0015FF6B7F|nr:aminoacyl-tRNA hydrolase [Rhodopirellula sp. JC639]